MRLIKDDLRYYVEPIVVAYAGNPYASYAVRNIFVPEFRYIADRLFRATIQKPKRNEISAT